MGGERLVDAQIDFFLAEFYKVGEVRHCGGGLSELESLHSTMGELQLNRDSLYRKIRRQALDTN